VCARRAGGPKLVSNEPRPRDETGRRPGARGSSMLQAHRHKRGKPARAPTHHKPLHSSLVACGMFSPLAARLTRWGLIHSHTHLGELRTRTCRSRVAWAVLGMLQEQETPAHRPTSRWAHVYSWRDSSVKDAERVHAQTHTREREPYTRSSSLNRPPLAWSTEPWASEPPVVGGGWPMPAIEGGLPP